MNTACFDHMIRAVAHQVSRRGLAGLLGLAALGAPRLAAAKKKHKRKKRKKKKVTFNDFGCVDVGKFCKNSSQCCSGICQGKKDKKTCQVHDTGGCQAGDDVCADTGNEECQEDGRCFRTTGNASFCAKSLECFTCAKDVDCEPDFGPGAACAVCADACAETGGTLCAAPASETTSA